MPVETDELRDEIGRLRKQLVSLRSEREFCESYKKQWVESIMLMEERARQAGTLHRLTYTVYGAWESCKHRIYRMPRLHSFLRRCKRKLIMLRSDGRVLSCYERCKPYVMRIPVVSGVARRVKRFISKVLS